MEGAFDGAFVDDGGADIKLGPSDGAVEIDGRWVDESDGGYVGADDDDSLVLTLSPSTNDDVISYEGLWLGPCVTPKLLFIESKSFDGVPSLPP